MKMIFLAFIAFTFIGCEKKGCYTCSTINTKTGTQTNDGSEHCGWTKKTAKEYGESKTNSFQINGVTYYRRTVCYIK